MVILPPRIQNATASKYYVYSRMQKHNKQRYESPITINMKIEKDEAWKKEKKPKPNFDKPIEKEPGILGRVASIPPRQYANRQKENKVGFESHVELTAKIEVGAKVPHTVLTERRAF